MAALSEAEFEAYLERRLRQIGTTTTLSGRGLSRKTMEKNVLDPVEWLKVLPERTKLAPVEYDASCSAPGTTIMPTNKEERIQNALDRYNSALKGSRHHEGYRLVCALLAAEEGDESNIRTHLNRAYSFDYHKLNDRIRDAREWYESR